MSKSKNTKAVNDAPESRSIQGRGDAGASRNLDAVIESRSSSPATGTQINTAGESTERIERRDYGVVLVRTPRDGVKIETLMPEKRRNSR